MNLVKTDLGCCVIVTSILFYLLFLFPLYLLPPLFFLSLLALGLSWTLPVFLTWISTNFKGVLQGITGYWRRVIGACLSCSVFGEYTERVKENQIRIKGLHGMTTVIYFWEAYCNSHFLWFILRGMSSCQSLYLAEPKLSTIDLLWRNSDVANCLKASYLENRLDQETVLLWSAQITWN